MKKEWSLLMIFCLSAIMLAACNENTVEEDVKEEVQIEGQNEVKKEQEMTLDEGRKIVTDLYKKIIDELVTYGEQQGIEGEENITDTQVAEVMEKLKPYATGTYYEEDLKFIAANFCYGGCGNFYFNYYYRSSNFIKGDIESISSTEIKMTEYLVADPIGDPAYKYVTTLLLEENTWKIAKVEGEEVSDLQITENEIVTIANKAGYENVKVSAVEKQTINGVDTTVYKVKSETHEITLLGTTGEIIEVVALNVATEEVEDEDEYDFDKLVQEYYDDAKNQVMPTDYGDAYQNANTTKSIKEAKASIQKLYTETEKQVVALMSEEVDYTESKAKAEEAQSLWHEFRETMLKELVPNMSKKEAKKLLENLFKNDAYLEARVYEESGGVGTYTAEVAYLYYTFIEEDTKKLYETFVLNK